MTHVTCHIIYTLRVTYLLYKYLEVKKAEFQISNLFLYSTVSQKKNIEKNPLRESFENNQYNGRMYLRTTDCSSSFNCPSSANILPKVFYTYTYSSAAWLTLQALPLITSPTIMVTLLSPEVREPTGKFLNCLLKPPKSNNYPALEDYFSRSLGIALLTIGILLILLTGSVPLTSSISAVSTEDKDPTAPYAVPALTISFFYHSANTVFCYTRYTTNSQASYALGAVGSGLLACVGLWLILFSSTSGRISRKTGADKRTSAFPFGNKESASEKKRALKKGI
jgi:hypothetical protein